MKPKKVISKVFCICKKLYGKTAKKLNALNIVIIYIILGSAWILLSDKIAGLLVRENNTLVIVSIYKGWFYVLCTAVLLYLLINCSIKEINKSKNELKINEERYKLVINNTTDGFWDWDILNNKINYPEEWKIRLGYEKKEISDNAGDMERFLHPDDISELKNSIKQYLEGKQTKYKQEVRVVTKTGEVIWVQIRGQAIWDNDGSPLRMLGTVTNINERKLTEVALKNTMEMNEKLLNEALEYNKLKTEFFTNISHEFRTPLNVILSVVQVLSAYERMGKETISLERVNKYMRNIRQNCYRLLKLINNLIDVTRIDSGFLKLQMKNVDIVEVVNQIVGSVTEFIKIKQLDLIFESNIQKKIMAIDVDKFERIMLNLISNAIKFTKPGGKITIKIHDFGDKVDISVKDTGVGIEKNKCSIIFERFRQVNTSLVKDTQGSGIGLSIVKSLVEMHDGHIKVDSEIGKGSEFILTFPVKILNDEELEGEYHNCVNNMKNDGVERAIIEFSDIYLQSNQELDIS